MQFIKKIFLDYNIFSIMSSQKANEFKALGNTAFQSGKFQEAIQYFTKAIQLNPNDHVFYSNRSGAYASLQQYDQALEDASKCISVKPDWPKGYKRKGLAQFFLGDLDEAITTYKTGLKLDPNNAQLKEDLKRVEQRKAENDQGMDPNELLKNPQNVQIFMKLLTNPQTKDFINDPTFMSKFQMLLKNPSLLPMFSQQDPRIRKAFEVINSQDNPDMQELIRNMNKGGQRPEKKTEQPKQEQPKQEQPKEQPKEQHKHQHHDHKHEHHDHDHGHGHQHHDHGHQHHKNPSKKEEPKKQQKKAEKMEQQNSPQEIKNRGNAQFKKKNFTRALELYDQAIVLAPNQVLYYNNKAAAYIQLGNLEKALQQIQKAQAIIQQGKCKDYVKKAKIYSRKASIFSKQQKYDLAIQWYGKSLVEDNNVAVKDECNKLKKLKKQLDAKAYINPEIAQKHNQQGTEKFKAGKFPDALKEYEEAIKRNPNVAKYHSNLATTYIKLMEFARAREALDTAIKIDPNYIKAYPKKGDCHYALKEYHKALQIYEKGLKIDPQNELCKAGVQKTQLAIFNSSSKEDAEERSRHAMADPEIQAILKTPEIQNVLNDLQNDPKSASKAFQNPQIAAKLQKLIAAGVLRTG